MESVKKQTKVEAPSREGLHLMVELVESEYPVHQVDNYSKLAFIINKEFGTSITEDELVELDALRIEAEDRRLTYKHATGY